MKKLFLIGSIILFLMGTGAILGGIKGLIFTYQSVAAEDIVTTADASVPNTKVRGPFTLKAQADVIRKHMMAASDGKTYAQMPREIEKHDENNNPVLDEQGQPIMVANEARDRWVAALALTNALNLAVAAYVISAMAILLGIASLGNGFLMYVFYLRERAQ